MGKLLLTANSSPARFPKYVDHPSIRDRRAHVRYSAAAVAHDSSEFDFDYMPDEVTRERARQMHYSAYRVHRARLAPQAEIWRQRYYRQRDSIVLGNRKLIYKAVRRFSAAANYGDDLIGECQIVLINAVAAYNPWLGIRFSTYAFTCLIRALARQSQRIAADRLSHALALNVATDVASGTIDIHADFSWFPEIDALLRDDHPLLSPREKSIIRRRYFMPGEQPMPTLEKVGREMGLSKERVRQVQAHALDKLRSVLI